MGDSRGRRQQPKSNPAQTPKTSVLEHGSTDVDADVKRSKKPDTKKPQAARPRRTAEDRSKRPPTPPKKPTVIENTNDKNSKASFPTMVRVALSANKWRRKQREAAKSRREEAEAEAAETGAADAETTEESTTTEDSTSKQKQATSEQAHSDQIVPTVNGMRVFGVIKGQMQRAVIKFDKPPDKQPLTVCFHFPNTFLTHRYVLDMMRLALKNVEGSRVKTIQFIDRNTLHGTQGLDNRWLVSVNMPEAVECLVQDGFLLYNRRIVIRRYDDILMEEYNEYQEYIEHENRFYTMRSKLLDVAHGETAHIDELKHMMLE